VVEIRILGGIEVRDADRQVALPAMPRRLLAALVTRAGETAPGDVLIEALWDGRGPPSAAKLLQVYVSQLRKALPAPSRIHTRAGGYALELAQGSLDADRFERLLDEGRAVMRDGNPALAASLLDRALALWQGPAYGEFAYDEFARADAERLEELRLATIEERIEAGLALGHHVEFLPELRELTGSEPLRERPIALAMVAFYRCGRQTEALELFAATRARMRDELGLEPGTELRELQRRILQQDPALTLAFLTPDPFAALPASPNALLGRQREVAELHDLLVRDDVRLLVLTGAGGSGKTRLALEVARATAGSFANGAAFVELAPLQDPNLLPAAIARALTIESAPGEDPLDTVAKALRPRELLLVLDNAEHLRAALPTLSELLARVPRLTLLVTSRAVLHLSGEHVYPVQPLTEEPAVVLFCQRAQDADVRFAPTTVDQQAIRRICKRLDGLPLAIELAAARTRILTPGDLLERLASRLPLLTGGPRDLPARQQTLRSTLDWSFNLLSGQERQLATRLAVFVGGFDLEAAGQVCDADIDELTALVDQSLLGRSADGSFFYLQTIREFALERLQESSEADEIRRRHCEFFVVVAQAADISAVRRRGGADRLDSAAVAQHNLRAALAWTVESGSVALGLELATALERFWVTRDPHEGMRWFEALLARPEAQAIAPTIRAGALRAFGGATDIAGHDAAAERLYEQSLALFDQLGDESGRAVLLHRLGISALRRSDLANARELVHRSHEIHEQAGNRWGQAQTLGALGAITRDAGEHVRAAELIQASAAMAREAGVRWWESGMLAELASLALNAGCIDEAETRARESLVLADEIGDRAGRVFGVGLLARVCAERGQPERSMTLWASIHDADAVAPLGGWRRHRQAHEARIRDTLGDEMLLVSADRPLLTLDDAVALALQPHDAARPRATKAEMRGRQA
jgi:predicted ATPase/DNA-binding SARP family transcriptional activator